MPIKLNSNSEKLHGGRIDKAMVIQMVDYYRSNRPRDSYSLKFAHFSVLEVVDLLVDNGIISPLSIYDRDHAKTFGLKIYVANHADDIRTCPAGRETEYKKNDTVILCNTTLDGYIWNDMLSDNTHFISLVGTGNGLDKGSICPPDCPPKKDADQFYPTDVSSNP